MSLILKNINKSFNGSQVLQDFSYSFNEHGIYILKGKSGIGKTTLLRLICGLDKSFSGIIDGGGLQSSSFMFQEYRLFPNLSALDNVKVSVSKNDTDAARNAKDLLLRLGFTENDLKKKPNELSGGMKQRIAFVRALVHKSPILLLDEPTKELNKEIIAVMTDIIKKEAEHRLIIIVTHEDVLEFLPNSEIINL